MLSKYLKVLVVGTLMLCGFMKTTIATPLRIVTTAFPQYDFVRAIVKDKGEVSMLLKIGAEAHSFEPTPKDLIAIEKASLFVYNGGENDEWIEDFIESIDHKVKTFAFVEKVETRPEEELEGVEANHHHQHHHNNALVHEKEHKHEHESANEQEHELADTHEHEHEHEHQSAHKHELAEGHKHEHEQDDHFDEHVWTSPVNDLKILKALCDTIVELDPKNKEFYEKNARAYMDQFVKIDKEYRKIVENAPHKTIIFGDLFPLLYFAKDYNLTYYAAFNGCSNETEVSAATMKFLVDKAKNTKAKVIFKIELTSDNLASTIAEACGAKVMTFNTGHNLNLEQYRKGTTMAMLFEENFEPLRTALGL